MKTIPAIPFLGLLLILMLGACDNENDPIANAEARVVSEENTIIFSELNMLINLRNSFGQPILLPQLDSIELMVDGNIWAAGKTTLLDTSLFTSNRNGDFYTSSQSIAHEARVSESDIQDVDDFSTAGEYASLLNQEFDMEPGEYVCLITAVYVTDADGNQRIYHPYVYKPFEVAEDRKSAYIGEINIILD